MCAEKRKGFSTDDEASKRQSYAFSLTITTQKARKRCMAAVFGLLAWLPMSLSACVAGSDLLYFIHRVRLYRGARLNPFGRQRDVRSEHMEFTIRRAAVSDAADILQIYAPFITDTCVTFDTEVPTVSEFAARIENIMKGYPYLVCEGDNKVIGYAYASKHRDRSAYKYSADVSVYIARGYQGRGIGGALYTRLFELLGERRGIYTAYAGITLPNEKSVGLHKAFGFSEIGVYHNVGYKLGRWLDVMWMEKPLRQYDTPVNSGE